MSKNTNTGKGNPGYSNSGDWNSGDGNSGYSNSGDWNPGDGNSGDGNSGNRNSGDWNSGNRNSGYGNKSDRQSGIFNSTETTVRMFNKETNLKWEEIDHPNFYGFNLNEWVSESEMTDEEKKADPQFFVRGGYLKTYEWEEAWANFWRDTDEENCQKFLNLPNFDADVFKEITGIDVTKNDVATIDIGGTKYEVTDELKDALKKLKKA